MARNPFGPCVSKTPDARKSDEITSAIWRPSATLLPAAVSAGAGATKAGTAMERVLEVSNSTNSGSSDAGAAGGGVCAMAACVPKMKSRKDASFRLRAKSDIYLIPLSRSAQT